MIMDDVHKYIKVVHFTGVGRTIHQSNAKFLKDHWYMYDLNKIKEEIKLYLKWNEQICLQGTSTIKDPFGGTKRLKIYQKKKNLCIHYLIYLTSILLLKNIIYIELD